MTDKNLDNLFTTLSIQADVINLKVEYTSKLIVSGSKDISLSASSAIDTSSEESTNTNICKLVEKIRKFQNIISGLETLSNDVNYVFTTCVKYINYAAVEIIMKKITIISLYIKRLLTILKIKIAEMTKKLLVDAISFKGPSLGAILILPVIYALKLVANIILGILIVVNKIIEFLPNILTIEPFGMAFIFSIKKMFTGSITGKEDMIILNTNKNCLDRLPNAIKMSINEITKENEKLNNGLKIAAISAGAAAGVAQAVLTTKEFSPEICAQLNKLDLDKVIKAIELIIAGLVIPFPLPKYEKLNMLNIGFLNWLITGFVPAGHNSFGIPGQP